IEHDSSHELGQDPGLVKDGVEDDLQRLLAEQIHLLGTGSQLIRREYMTAIGPVDILAKNPSGETVAVELKRRGDIDGVEQLSRYVELLNRDPLLAPVHGVFAAQQIKPQARVLAQDRGFDTLTLDTMPCEVSMNQSPDSSNKCTQTFADRHIHGIAGVDFATSSISEITAAIELLARRRTTNVTASIPTVPVTAFPDILQRLWPLVADNVLDGIHLEGPF